MSSLLQGPVPAVDAHAYRQGSSSVLPHDGERGLDHRPRPENPSSSHSHDSIPGVMGNWLPRLRSRTPRVRPVQPHRDSGAVMVEMAFVLTLLVMLLVGVTTSALAFGQNNTIENAAREASRYAATLPDAADSAWLAEVRDVARASALGELDAGVDGQYICVAYYDGSNWVRLTDTGGVTATGSASCYTDSLPADQARVQVVTGRDTSINAVIFSTDISLDGQAAARYER